MIKISVLTNDRDETKRIKNKLIYDIKGYGYSVVQQNMSGFSNETIYLKVSDGFTVCEIRISTHPSNRPSSDLYVLDTGWSYKKLLDEILTKIDNFF